MADNPEDAPWTKLDAAAESQAIARGFELLIPVLEFDYDC